MQLSQLRIIVADFDAAVRYYKDVIGLPPQTPSPQPPYAAFKPVSGTTLAVHDRAALASTLGSALRADDRVLVALRVDDLAVALDDVIARGGDVLAGPMDISDRVRAAYLRDPDGILLEIQQWLVG